MCQPPVEMQGVLYGIMQGQLGLRCGNLATTNDHISPQSLLPGVPKRERSNMPSCEACKSGAPNDDEYVRDVIASDLLSALWRGDGDRGGAGAGEQSSSGLIRLPQEGK
jgi:hypothetical protein